MFREIAVEISNSVEFVSQEEINNRCSIAPALPADFQRWHDAGRIPKGNTGSADYQR